ncbi:MAG: VTT domain-containing protein [Caldilineaceae bacterium]
MKMDRIPYRWWLFAILLVGAGLFWRFGGDLWRLLRDEQALEAFVVRLGWLGPLALILGNALQIIIAPIPGYIVQLTAGFLYGPLWGGLWSAIGLMIGSMAAMWLGRTYGRPLVERLVGQGRLDRWERVTFSDHPVVWFILLAAPIGDLPYYLAGLAQVSFLRIALLIILVRVPSVFVAAAIGSGVIGLTWWQIALIFGLGGSMLLLFLRYQEQLLQWIDGRVQERL